MAIKNFENLKKKKNKVCHVISVNIEQNRNLGKSNPLSTSSITLDKLFIHSQLSNQLWTINSALLLATHRLSREWQKTSHIINKQ